MPATNGLGESRGGGQAGIQTEQDGTGKRSIKATENHSGPVARSVSTSFPTTRSVATERNLHITLLYIIIANGDPIFHVCFIHHPPGTCSVTARSCVIAIWWTPISGGTSLTAADFTSSCLHVAINHNPLCH